MKIAFLVSIFTQFYTPVLIVVFFEFEALNLKRLDHGLWNRRFKFEGSNHLFTIIMGIS